MSEPLPIERPRAPAGGRGRLGDLVAHFRSGEDPRAATALLLVVAVAAGFLWYRAGISGGTDMAGAVPPPVERPPAPTTTTTTGVVVVHVAGAVARPGLYRLPSGSRVADAVEAAGGPAPRGDLDRLNLAARLGDGQRVAVARVGEPTPPGPPGNDEEAADGGGEPVDLNSAGRAELEALPGIGPATARAILEERARLGGFRSVNDLLGVRGIGERRFAELRRRVRV